MVNQRGLTTDLAKVTQLSTPGHHDPGLLLKQGTFVLCPTADPGCILPLLLFLHFGVRPAMDQTPGPLLPAIKNLRQLA